MATPQKRITFKESLKNTLKNMGQTTSKVLNDAFKPLEDMDKKLKEQGIN